MDEPLIIDMTPDGEFREPPPPGIFARTIQVIVALGAMAVAVLVVLVALWFAVIAVAIGIAVALVAWAVWSWRHRARA